jgi:hypothetical protein
MSLRPWRAGLVGLSALGVAACAGTKERAPAPAPVVAAAAPLAPAAPAAPPAIVVREVRAACVPRDLPRPPRYPDTDRALRRAAGAADRYQLLAAGRLLRERRLAVLERIVAACR